MKKIFFLFAMLASVAASAQSTVQITPLSATYTATPTIQFEVRWTNQSTDNHRNKVWIFIDFQPVISPTQKGNWQPATITGTVQKTAGTLSGQTDRGFFLEGITTNFSSTLTVQISNTGAPFNWCAYGSDYPPNVRLENEVYTFKGTIDFIVSSHAQPVATTTIAKASLTVNSSSTFTDATGCPGIGSLYCPYTGNDLYMDATHLCQQRAGGAQNWEAYIKDDRDDKLYRIVAMPDNNWWLAQNVKLASYNGSTVGAAISGCSEDDCGRAYPINQVWIARGGSSGSTGNVQGVCPPGWLLPTLADWTTFKNNLGSTDAQRAERIRALNSNCSPRTDYFGWSDPQMICNGIAQPAGSNWYMNTDCNHRTSGILIDHLAAHNNCSHCQGCGAVCLDWCHSTGSGGGSSGAIATVRCFR
ncbi:MAG: hypothetical protein LBU42_09360 [Prevotellaceae bacterium]|jgi:uncharacterized protein (TIGR02145 family)|nr:hypothetical protein [Prevotellaceae bacterium]